MTLLHITLFIGLLGAFLMFLGDMILYYNKDDYSSEDTLKSITGIMKTESRTRLYIGALLGPISAFLYCVGFYHIVLFIDDAYSLFGWICFFINSLAIISGGTCHSHCANLGLIGRHNDEDTLDEVIRFLSVQRLFLMIAQGIGLIALAVFIVLGWTAIPRWMSILNPAVLIMLTSVVRKLPKGFHMIICGGWSNLVFVIYYIAVLIYCIK